MFGHSDGNYEFLQKLFMLGYQNHILPETLGQYSFDTLITTVSRIFDD